MSQNTESDSTESQSATPSAITTPLRAWSGALISGSIAILLYNLTYSIALSFARHPSAASSQTARSLSSAVRTLVVGLSTMATGLFALAGLGLFLLGLKLLVQKVFVTQPKP